MDSVLETLHEPIKLCATSASALCTKSASAQSQLDLLLFVKSLPSSLSSSFAASAAFVAASVALWACLLACAADA
eukprot:9264896-Prorocentrum_lima.AAC.1